MIPCPPPKPPARLGLTQEQVRKHYLGLGYAPAYNHSAHIYKEVTMVGGEKRRYRIVISRVAVRKEVQITHTGTKRVEQGIAFMSVGHKEWLRTRSGYLKNLWLWNGLIFGLTSKGC